MIIPVKCVTCGKVIADKYRYYLNKVREKKLEEQPGGDDVAIDKAVCVEHVGRVHGATMSVKGEKQWWWTARRRSVRCGQRQPKGPTL